MASDRVSFAPRRTTVGRTTAGLMALSYPIVMVVMALAVGPREAGDLQDVASSFIAAVMRGIANHRRDLRRRDQLASLVRARYGAGRPLGDVVGVVPSLRHRHPRMDAGEPGVVGRRGDVDGLGHEL